MTTWLCAIPRSTIFRFHAFRCVFHFPSSLRTYITTFIFSGTSFFFLVGRVHSACVRTTIRLPATTISNQMLQATECRVSHSSHLACTAIQWEKGSRTIDESKGTEDSQSWLECAFHFRLWHFSFVLLGINMSFFCDFCHDLSRHIAWVRISFEYMPVELMFAHNARMWTSTILWLLYRHFCQIRFFSSPL